MADLLHTVSVVGEVGVSWWERGSPCLPEVIVPTVGADFGRELLGCLAGEDT